MSKGELIRYLKGLAPEASEERRFAAMRELRFLMRCGLRPSEVLAVRPDLGELIVSVMTGLMIESLEGRFVKAGETLAEGRRRAIEEARRALNSSGVASIKAIAPLTASMPSECLVKAVSRELDCLSRHPQAAGR